MKLLTTLIATVALALVAVYFADQEPARLTPPDPVPRNAEPAAPVATIEIHDDPLRMEVTPAPDRIPMPPGLMPVAEHERIVEEHEQMAEELRRKIADLESQLKLVGTLPIAALLAQQGVRLHGSDGTLSAEDVHQFLGRSQLWVDSDAFFEATRKHDPMTLWNAAVVESDWANETRRLRNKPNIDKSIDPEVWRTVEWPRIWSERERELRDEMAKVGFSPDIVERYLSEVWR